MQLMDISLCRYPTLLIVAAVLTFDMRIGVAVHNADGANKSLVLVSPFEDLAGTASADTTTLVLKFKPETQETAEAQVQVADVAGVVFTLIGFLGCHFRARAKLQKLN